MSRSSFLYVLLFFLITGITQSRFITRKSSDEISDGGIRNNLVLPSVIQLPSSSGTCEETYGFLPCTNTALGNLVLITAYGYVMFLAAKCLTNGSELLLAVMGTGIIGGLFLPMLGALPDAMLILVSGLSGSKETAQKQVLIGMGLLSGSSVMLLTLIWGTCVVIGKKDFEEHVTSTDTPVTRISCLTGSGITTDKMTSYAARIMIISLLPYIIVQLPQLFDISSGSRVVILISLIISIAFLLAYCLFQILLPVYQERKIAYAKLKCIISSLFLGDSGLSSNFLTESGEVNEKTIESLFRVIDKDENGQLSYGELSGFITGANIKNLNLEDEGSLEKLMKDFDTDDSSTISLDEFKKGITKWVEVAKCSVLDRGISKSFVRAFHEESKEEHQMLTAGNEENLESVENPAQIYLKAIFLLLLGTILAAVFADPLVDAVDNFSSATSIPSFFISFIAMPLATNSSEAVSAIIFASRKTEKTASLTFSELYGAVTMNNTLCLSVFFALVYVRHLTWDFSAEVLVILIVCVAMGILGSFRVKFPLWTSSIAFLLYPLSLLLVYILDYVLGWS